MASEEDNIHKRRRLQRACDFCRRKKIRCDGVVLSPKTDEERCSNCKLYNATCTYVQAAQKRATSGAAAKGSSHVESLEDRVERMDTLLTNLVGPTARSAPLQTSPTSSPSTQSSGSPSSSTKQTIEGTSTPEDSEEYYIITDNFEKLQVGGDAWSRFFGKSSSAQLVHTALELKHGVELSPIDKKVLEDTNVCNWTKATGGGNLLMEARPEFKNKPYWEDEVHLKENMPAYIFPEPNLFKSLVEAYFSMPNMMTPILHRQTFDRLVAQGMHRKDQIFGAVTLLVLANGARFLKDPRVLLEGEKTRRSSGWMYFTQVQTMRRSLLAPPSIFDVQFYALYANYLFGTSAPQSSWTVIGMGLRSAQDVGAHRKKKTSHPTIEDEMWKRAFWTLLCMDRQASLDMGRPCSIHDDDIDVALPIEVDDEYWDHPDPEQRFKQPPGKPSYMSYFVAYIKLHQIVGTCLRTLYSANKNRPHQGKDWEQNLVTELDSTLNRWVDAVPEHLRWDPHRQDEIFFNQSVSLYATYYNLQVLIHKPFIPTPRNASPAFPSLAICTNASRSLSHIVSIQRARGFTWAQAYIMLQSFAAGIVLLLNIWGGKRTRLSLNPVKEMVDVHNCMQVLKDMENSVHFAGRLWDILYQLASVSELPLPEANASAAFKRRRDSDAPIDHEDDHQPSQFVESSASGGAIPLSANTNGNALGGLGTLAGRSGSRPGTGMFSPPVMNDQLHRLLAGGWGMPPESLPVHSQDLGRLPVHPPQSPSGGLSGHDMSGWSPDMNGGGFPGFVGETGLDDVTAFLWANTPNGMGVDDWSAYISGAMDQRH
ncbi:hypothetical protein CYLTODRAFT_424817 [Cylindrobasidium torrendii FP15055 ss-10]|uniref:Zn(2)-C6 fungal-type domain-containing protein n=1 Tax=Cylindrobasidium torrendii FP15055 ss-10 TaxID=1314674 RepID=A0A0D7B330_9AGAR|nr:hypothetical protein CYLTODRAFT_424817 [Cylindrobasidium torrendii FP15055 ss-10]